jgi:hypothetical protein
MTVTNTEVEVNFSTTIPETVECNMCKRSTPREDIFPLGTQDPLNRVVAILFFCRGCFVMNTSLDMRRLLFELWDV